MAKRILLESYTFAPGSRTITINNRYLRREQLILITNVTTNTIIYNFASSSLTATQNGWVPSFTSNGAGTIEQTVITLTYDTTTMYSTDKLSILVEEVNETFQPNEAQMDPIGKIRVSTPQSLIDTDFEYGTQPTKWETLPLCNNRASAFYDNTIQIGIATAGGLTSGIVTTGSSSRTVTVYPSSVPAITVSWIQYSAVITIPAQQNPIVPGMVVTITAGGIPVGATIVGYGTAANTYVMSTPATSATGNGAMTLSYNFTTTTPVYIQDATVSGANGWVLPTAVNTTSSVITSFTYNARDPIASNTNIFDPSKTYVYQGSFYSQAGIAIATGLGSVSLGFTVTSGSNILCITAQPHGLTVGSAIFVVGTNNANVNGTWFVKTVQSAVSFTFDVISGTPGATTITQVGSGLTLAITVSAFAPTGQVLTAIVVAGGTGYNIGDVISIPGGTTTAYVKVLSTGAVGVVNQVGIYGVGAGYTATTVASPTSATSTANTIYSGSTLYPRSWGFSIHRAFDGGVTFSAGMPYHGNQLIRQTRRYFRYQSGKGIMFSTGSNFCSPYQVDSLTAVGSTVTVTTKFPHNLGIGAAIKVSNVDQAAYNGQGVSGGTTFVVLSTPTDTTFTYSALSNPSASPATGVSITVQPYRWYGASVRCGMFDSQNGFFFQYDGQTMYAVRRSSTTQLAGYISNLGQGATQVTGTNTKWSTQLVPGDFVVIRGGSYTVVSIESDTSINIYPDYRGTVIAQPSQVVMSKTIDTKIPQSAWNIDTCDGLSASGFNWDPTKMQMYIIDYAWYGAGAIRWGFKNARGEAMYVHRMAHGNNMTEAYMRSGNLPARYEVNTFWPYTKLTQSLSAGETATMYVTDTTGFPTTGWVCLQLPGTALTSYTEYVYYTGKTGNTFTGLTRGVNTLVGPGGLTGGGGQSTGQSFTYSVTAPVMITVYAPQAANTISHWGSAVIMDGRYDDDKSLVFVAGMQTAITAIAAGTTQPLISIRIAPSVDSGITGIVGQREIINRMQLIMRSMATLTSGTATNYLITLRLNGFVAAGTGTLSNFGAAGGSSLAQVCYHNLGNTISAGEPIYAFFPNASGVTYEDLSQVRDIGTSILGGGNTLSIPTNANNRYPDGPDIITICVTNLNAVAAGSINARISWTEAQA